MALVIDSVIHLAQPFRTQYKHMLGIEKEWCLLDYHDS